MEQPKKIGKYELRDYLGGGMSHVFKAWDPVMNRVVVVKILKSETSADPEAKARFLREAQTAGSLSHDNIIRVYDYGEEGGRPYMVMEYLEGQDLKEAMATGAAGDLSRRLRIAHDIAQALAYIHSQRIVHRDIKPENIHLDKDGRVRLMDFGIAKRPELGLTRTGFTLGTPYYMAPEQVQAEEVTHLADIYAFGILLYELFSGARPHKAEKIEQLFYQILNTPVDLAPLHTAGVPESVCSLVGRCTAKRPANRPQSLAEAGQILGEAREALGRPVSSRPTEPAGPLSRRRLPLVAAAVVVIAVIVGYALWPEPAPEPPPEPPPLADHLITPTGEMLLVPEGSFLFGEDAHPETLPPYYIDRTEVTNEAYQQFCVADGRPLPPGFPKDGPGLPVVNVSFIDARAFAAWAGKRLPSPLEWEKAARGTDGRPLPWGSDQDPSRANVADNGAGPPLRVLPADSFSAGASPYGVLQMAGNVWEFVDERITPSPGALKVFAGLLSPPPTAEEPWYTIRGGAFDIPLVPDVTYQWSAVPARYAHTNIGFRCVKDAR